MEDLWRKPIQYRNLLSNRTSPPVASLARHIRRRHDAPIWIDEVNCQEATVAWLGAVEEAEGIEACLEDLAWNKQARVGSLEGDSHLGN